MIILIVIGFWVVDIQDTREILTFVTRAAFIFPSSPQLKGGTERLVATILTSFF